LNRFRRQWVRRAKGTFQQNFSDHPFWVVDQHVTHGRRGDML